MFATPQGLEFPGTQEALKASLLDVAEDQKGWNAPPGNAVSFLEAVGQKGEMKACEGTENRPM